MRILNLPLCFLGLSVIAPGEARDYSVSEVVILNAYCEREVGPESYCKTYQDDNEAPFCHGKDIHCDLSLLEDDDDTEEPEEPVDPVLIPVDEAACAMDGAHRLGTTMDQGTIYLTSMGNIRKCLDATTTTHGTVLMTYHQLLYGVANSYSFTDICVDVSEAFKHQSNTCGLKQFHQVAVNLEEFLNDKIAWYAQQMRTMNNSERSAFMASEVHAYPFHSELLRLFNNLHDAHTLYVTPYFFTRMFAPFAFRSGLNADGDQEIRVVPVPALVQQYELVYGGAPFDPPLPMEGRVVKTVNGELALDFLLQQVDNDAPWSGFYQGHRQRLNAWLLNFPAVVIVPSLFTLPSFDQFDFGFDDGSAANVGWVGRWSDFSDVYDMESMLKTSTINWLINMNPAFDDYFEHYPGEVPSRNSLWQTTQRAARPNKFKAVSNTVDLSFSGNMKAPVSKLYEALRKTNLNVEKYGPQSTVIDMMHGRTRSDTSGDQKQTDESIAAGWVKLSGMEYRIDTRRNQVVVKVPSFVPERRHYLDNDFYYFPDFAKVQVAARDAGVTRLLFDFTGNGGGYVVSSYGLQAWFYDEDYICSPIQLRMTTDSSRWVESFGLSLEDNIKKQIRRGLGLKNAPLGSVENIEAVFEEMRQLAIFAYKGLGFGEREMGTSEVGFLSHLEALKDAILAKPLESDRAAALGGLYLNIVRKGKGTKAFFGPQTVADYVTAGSGDGWFPYTTSEYTGVGGAPFDPKLSQFTDLKTQKWGKNGRYSQKAEFGFCREAIRKMKRSIIKPSYERDYWTEKAFVTDGSCGSACAMTTQNMWGTGAFAAFTYGGVKDQAIDVASFAGGNVEEYGNVWPITSFAGFLGSFASMHTSPWDAVTHKSFVNTNFAFPTPAEARFNFNMMFAKMLGPNSLPRQYYVLPGDRHLNIWNVEDTYGAIGETEDWNALMAHPQYEETHGNCPWRGHGMAPIDA